MFHCVSGINKNTGPVIDCLSLYILIVIVIFNIFIKEINNIILRSLFFF